jgi:undecaprenyl-diphosphatase
VWPKARAPLFGLAAIVGLSRIYLGAHYPGDVAFGALLGALLSELTRRVARRFIT